MPEEIAEDLSRSEAVITSPVKCGWGLSRLNVVSCEGAVGFMWTSVEQRRKYMDNEQNIRSREEKD